MRCWLRARSKFRAGVERKQTQIPSTPLEDGVAQTIADYREHGIEETYTHLKLLDADAVQDRG